MTTSTAPPAVLTKPGMYTPARPQSRPCRSRVGAWLRTGSIRIRRGLVASITLGLLTAAAFGWHTWAGLVAAAVSVLLVDHTVGVPDDHPRRQP